jgi:hypothetical protein
VIYYPACSALIIIRPTSAGRHCTVKSLKYMRRGGLIIFNAGVITKPVQLMELVGDEALNMSDLFSSKNMKFYFVGDSNSQIGFKL